MPPPRDLRIALFSGPRIELDDRDVTRALPGRQGRALLAYLAVRWPDATSRETLFGVIWPERAPADAPSDFRSVLAKVRSALWPDAIQGRELLTLELPEGAQLDVRDAPAGLAEAEHALAAGDAPAALALAQTAEATLARPFLPGLQGDWVEEYRRHFEEQHRRALEVIARAGLARGGGDLAHAERAARALVAQDRFREGGYELLMEVQAARGDVATALRTFDDLRVLLRDELGHGPPRTSSSCTSGSSTATSAGHRRIPARRRNCRWRSDAKSGTGHSWGARIHCGGCARAGRSRPPASASSSW